jgi:hypothetical protein
MLANLLLFGLVAAQPADLRADVEPQRFRLRTGRMYLGARWKPILSVPSWARQTAPCGLNVACGVSPQLGFDLELGSRAARLLLGTYTAPLFWFNAGRDVALAEFFILEIGGLFGGPNVRAGVSMRTGAILAVGGTALLRVTPLVGPRGGRHGFELRVGTGFFDEPLSVGLNYAWHPARLERKRARAT